MTRARSTAAGAAVVLAVTGVAMAASGGAQPDAVARTPAIDTVAVERGRLSAMVSQAGTLTYRAGPDGAPYAVTGQAAGLYTQLPASGDEVGCGEVLLRVDERPVVLLCGAVPAFRGLRRGAAGRDVRQLNGNLHRLGYDARARVRVRPGERSFTSATESALRALQRRRGLPVTGRLALGHAVFLPEAVRIAGVDARLGGPARPGVPMLAATSLTLQVQVSLDPSQQGEVEKGDRAQVTLPGNTPVKGRVTGFGRVARVPGEQGGRPADATVPTLIELDDPAAAAGLDRAPVQVDITTTGVADALSVPATALVGRSGGGFAVEVVRDDGRRELVTVTLGLFDTGRGRVQVAGRVAAGDRVVVPSR
ncbi:hypothetical protein DSM112329_03715 [Paraconexibacter sp. AEG42_29]|uniref:Peptidoglycan binding-like domain-containing protein n=1 Tax=Paraconexibacter sp. AEG42_29 TaxID=2997339 RepID=A0AAU7AYY4_9ACTN